MNQPTPPVMTSNSQLSNRLKSGVRFLDGPHGKTLRRHYSALTGDIRLPDKELPTQFEIDTNELREPDFYDMNAFVINLTLVVKEGLAGVLTEMDLGRTTLHEIEFIPGEDRQCEGRFFLVNLSEVRRFVVPLEDQGFNKHRDTGTVMRRSDLGRDRPFPVNISVGDIPAIWREKHMPGSLFFSRPCAEKIMEAGYGDAFDFAECRYAKPIDMTRAIRR